MLRRLFITLLRKLGLGRHWTASAGVTREEYQAIRELFASKRP
ncbi:MAG TPA: hypothetical protein VK101_02435 [Limnochordia bacterium]|nr:hypothetical protein [Limnochordia bacterium]